MLSPTIGSSKTACFAEALSFGFIQDDSFLSDKSNGSQQHYLKVPEWPRNPRSSFDFSRELKALNLEIISVNQSGTDDSSSRAKRQVFRNQLEGLQQQVRLLSSELKQLRNRYTSLLDALDWQNISSEISKEYLRIVRNSKNSRGFVQSSLEFAHLRQRELLDQIIMLKNTQGLKDKQILFLKQKIQHQRIEFEQKQALRKKELELKELQWKNKIDRVILERKEESSNTTESDKLSNVFDSKKLQRSSLSSSFFTKSITFREKPRINMTDRKPSDPLKRSYKNMCDKITRIQASLKQELYTYP